MTPTEWILTAELSEPITASLVVTVVAVAVSEAAVVVVGVVSSIGHDRAINDELIEEDGHDQDHSTNEDDHLHMTDEDDDHPLTIDQDDETDHIHRDIDHPLLVATEDNHLILCLDTSYVGLEL